MNRPFYKNEPTKLCTIDEACERYRLGKTMIRKIAEENNAIKHIGRCTRIDLEVMDKAISNF